MKAATVLALMGFAMAPGGADAAAAAKVAAPRTAAAPSCAAFMDGFSRAVMPRRATFERPLTITRGFFGDQAGVEVRVLSTGDDVEGTLKCKGETFLRFEVRVAAPVNEKLAADLKAYEEGSLVAAFGWDKAKVSTVVGAMSSDAAEYLRASVQRGDTYVSGKVEYHQGDMLDLGTIWTDTDRTFIITSQGDD